MKQIDQILSIINNSIQDNSFVEIETEKIEIKSLASTGGDWKELYKSACAFLNTEGGMVIIGIQEKNKSYEIKGYEERGENQLKLLGTRFTNQNRDKLDLEEYFHYQIKELRGKRVCVVFIDKLPEELKFVFYDNVAYKRILTGDHKKENKIDAKTIALQNERREEIVNAIELTRVETATINDLNVDKLNDYINLLNKEIKVEVLKSNIENAQPFLARKGFIQNDKPTLLGMLVCGDTIYDFLGGKCQVDAYVDSEILIAQNKKVIKDNIISLMESSISFVYRNIQVGVSHEKGGSQVPEYPEKLIRETINNALAHRNYRINKFCNVIIQPNKHIEIRNPGTFRNEQLLTLENPNIRRIIPVAKARNPKLADVLKVHDRWEGRGIGMASLTNFCLENQIDVPYFILRFEDISLYIQKGKVLDDFAENWLNSFEGYILKKNNGRELTQEEKIVLAYFYKSELLNEEDKYTVLLTPDNNHSAAINKLKKANLVYSHAQEQTKDYFINAIYLVDRELMKTDFYTELRAFFGGEFDNLSTAYKDVLNVIYQYNTYTMNQIVSASSIGTNLYLKNNKRVVNLTKYESFKRAIRKIFNNLESKKFIRRKDGEKYDFKLNENFERTPSLFD